MTVNSVIDFYFSQYAELEIKIEMWGGLKGQYKVYTKESFYETFKDCSFENEEVMIINFQTDIHDYNTKKTWECEFPMLYIVYKEEVKEND